MVYYTVQFSTVTSQKIWYKGHPSQSCKTFEYRPPQKGAFLFLHPIFLKATYFIIYYLYHSLYAYNMHITGQGPVTELLLTGVRPADPNHQI